MCAIYSQTLCLAQISRKNCVKQKGKIVCNYSRRDGLMDLNTEIYLYIYALLQFFLNFSRPLSPRLFYHPLVLEYPFFTPLYIICVTKMLSHDTKKHNYKVAH